MGKRGSARFAAMALAAAMTAASAACGQTAASWVNGVSGSWTDPTKWSTNPVYPNKDNPLGATYDVTIAAPGAYTITYSSISSDLRLNKLTLNNAGTTLNLTNLRVADGLSLQAGKLIFANIGDTAVTGPGTLELRPTGGGLTNVSLTDTSLVIGPPTDATSEFSGLSLNAGGAIALNNATIRIQGDPTGAKPTRFNLSHNSSLAASLSGTGQVVFDGGVSASQNSFNLAAPSFIFSQIPVIPAGVTVRTGTGSGTISSGGGNGNVINRGTISSETGRAIVAANLTNEGTLKVGPNSFVFVTTFTGAGGSIEINNGTFDFGGTDSLFQVGTVTRTGGTVNYTGTIANTGLTLDLSNTPIGVVNLGGQAKVTGGTLTASAGTPVFRTTFGTFDGVTLDGNFAVNANAVVRVQNGLTIAPGRTLSLGGRASQQPDDRTLEFFGSQTITGGTIVFDGGVAGTSAVPSRISVTRDFNEQNNNLNPTLTISPTTTIRTGSGNGVIGSINLADANIVNQGTIVAATPGTMLVIASGNDSTGTSWTNPGQIRAEAGMLVLGGRFATSATDNLTRLPAAQLAINGRMDNTGDTFDLDRLGSVALWPVGRIKGGSISGSAANPIVVPNGAFVPVNPSLQNAFLDNVTLDGAHIVMPLNGKLEFQNGVTLNNATIRMHGGDTQLRTSALASFAGTGTISIEDPHILTPATLFFGGTVAISSGITITTAMGAQGPGTLRAHMANDTFAGTILSEVPNGKIEIMGEVFPNQPAINTGTIRSANGGNLDLWSMTNNGTIQASGGELRLGYILNNGAITATNTAVVIDAVQKTSELGNFTRSGGSVTFLDSTLDNTGATLDLAAGMGSFTVVEGTLRGGTITSSGAGQKITVAATPAPFYNPTTFDGLSLAVDADIKGDLDIENGLTILDNRTLSIEIGSLDPMNKVSVMGPGTLGGNGQLVFNANSSIFLYQTSIGAGVTIRTGASDGTVGSVDGMALQDITNHGTLLAGVAGKTLTVKAANGFNDGTISATNGGILNLFGNWTNHGTISATNGGQLNLTGTVSGPGSFNVSNSQINIAGTLTVPQYKALPLAGNTVSLVTGGVVDATGDSLTLDATTGNLRLAGGTLKGGRVATSAGATYVVVPSTTSTFDGVTLASNLSIPNLGVVSVINGLTLENNVDVSLGSSGGTTELTFTGTQTLGGSGGTITFNGANPSPFTNQLRTASTGTITVADGVTIRTGTQGGRIAGTRPLVNQGTIAAETAGKSLVIDMTRDFTNEGTMRAGNGGTILLNSSGFPNFAGGTLTGGKYVADGGTINLLGRQVTTNAADVTLRGPASVMAAINTIATNAGKFTIRDGRNFTTAGALANAGTLHVGNASTLTVNGALTSTGKIQGNGTIVAASVSSSGTIAPGESPGTLSITSNLALAASSVLEIEIGGTAAGAGYDVLDVSGNLALDGTLKITFVNGFAPTADQQFDFLDFATVSGAFDSVLLPPLPDGVTWDTAALSTGGPAGVPEPGATALISAVAAALFLRRRRH